MWSHDNNLSSTGICKENSESRQFLYGVLILPVLATNLSFISENGQCKAAFVIKCVLERSTTDFSHRRNVFYINLTHLIMAEHIKPF